MIVQFLITSTEWTAISSAGHSGSCWLDEEGDGDAGGVDVRVVHSSAGVPSAGDVTKGRRIYRQKNNIDQLLLTADSAQDIYYARCKNSGDAVNLSVDMV